MSLRRSGDLISVKLGAARQTFVNRPRSCANGPPFGCFSNDRAGVVPLAVAAVRSMSLRSKARRAGPAIADDTRTSAHALNLDNYVPAYLTYLAGKISNSASAAYRPQFGIGITDWRIMALLATEPWISAGRVCDVIGLDKAAVSRSVRGMKSTGIVDVHRGDDDKNRQLIALTRKGLNLHDRIVKLSLKRERQLLKNFSAAERKLLLNFLSRMHAQVVDTNVTGKRRDIS
jgi:DNA-binding MarR family transcriptional regulator